MADKGVFMYIIIGAAAFIIGVVTTILYVCLAVKANNARRRKKRKAPAENKEDGKHKVEFVKIIVFFILLTYFVGLGFGIYAVKKILLDYPEWAIQALIALFGYIGTPTAAAIGFYCWKAKAENIIKIKKNYLEETEGIPVDLNNINI